MNIKLTSGAEKHGTMDIKLTSGAFSSLDKDAHPCKAMFREQACPCAASDCAVALQVCLELEQTWMESGVSEDAVSGHIQVEYLYFRERDILANTCPIV